MRSSRRLRENRTVHKCGMSLGVETPALQVVVHLHAHEEEALVGVQVCDVLGVVVRVGVDDVALRFR